MHVSSWCLLSHLEHLDPSEWSDWDDIEDAIDNELLSLSKPQSGEGEGNLGDQGCWSLCLLLCTPASGRPLGCLLVIRTIVSGHIFWRGSPLGIKLKEAVGLADSPGDIQVPLPLLYYPIQLGQWPFCPLVLSLGQG